jgi:hypothetical protein
VGLVFRFHGSGFGIWDSGAFGKGVVCIIWDFGLSVEAGVYVRPKYIIRNSKWP